MPEESENKNQPAAQPETDSSGAGGGRKIITAVGAGGDDGDANPPSQKQWHSDNQQPQHLGLKSSAIDAFSDLINRDYPMVFRTLHRKFLEFTYAKEELIHALTTMIISAYTVAQYTPKQNRLETMQAVCSYFSDEQLLRIIDLADRTPR